MAMAMQCTRTDTCAYASKRKHVNARYYDDEDFDGESRADVHGESRADVDSESCTDVAIRGRVRDHFRSLMNLNIEDLALK